MIFMRIENVSAPEQRPTTEASTGYGRCNQPVGDLLRIQRARPRVADPRSV